MFIGSRHVDKGFVLFFVMVLTTAALCLALLQPICCMSCLVWSCPGGSPLV